MIARAVIGANFGDEGKGLVTSYLCSQGAGTVVRFNGGAQAGHTVVMPDGRRHVFHHMGSGTFFGIPTFLSQHFICNPLLFLTEWDELVAMGVTPRVFAHPDCLVTTYVDMYINRQSEDHRAKKRHGSVGIGINETVNRSDVPELKITMHDIWHNRSSLESRLAQIADKWAMFRMGSKLDEPAMLELWLKACEAMAERVGRAGIGQCPDPVFEGAQGLLLDQNNKEYFPHVTRSNTGIKNVRELCAMAGIERIEPYYVSRTYMTRHGAGPLPGEDPKMAYHDDTNTTNDYQGSLRFASLDFQSLVSRCHADRGSDAYKLALTHADQLDIPETRYVDLTSIGPSYGSVGSLKPSAKVLKAS